MKENLHQITACMHQFNLRTKDIQFFDFSISNSLDLCATAYSGGARDKGKSCINILRKSNANDTEGDTGS